MTAQIAPPVEEIRAFLKENHVSVSNAGKLVGVNRDKMRFWLSNEAVHRKAMPYSVWFTIKTKIESGEHQSIITSKPIP